MRTGNIAVALAAALVAAAASGIEWHNLDDANWVCGPKYTPEMLEGKVILVDEWGVDCPPCRALLPRMEDIDTHAAWCRKARDWVNVSSTGIILPCDAFEGAALESGLFREGCNILERPLKDILMDSDYARVLALTEKGLETVPPGTIVEDKRL